MAGEGGGWSRGSGGTLMVFNGLTHLSTTILAVYVNVMLHS